VGGEGGTRSVTFAGDQIDHAVWDIRHQAQIRLQNLLGSATHQTVHDPRQVQSLSVHGEDVQSVDVPHTEHSEGFPLTPATDEQPGCTKSDISLCLPMLIKEIMLMPPSNLDDRCAAGRKRRCDLWQQATALSSSFMQEVGCSNAAEAHLGHKVDQRAVCTGNQARPVHLSPCDHIMPSAWHGKHPAASTHSGG
jgi:hypothetical protein